MQARLLTGCCFSFNFEKKLHDCRFMLVMIYRNIVCCKGRL